MPWKLPVEAREGGPAEEEEEENEVVVVVADEALRGSGSRGLAMAMDRRSPVVIAAVAAAEAAVAAASSLALSKLSCVYRWSGRCRCDSGAARMLLRGGRLRRERKRSAVVVSSVIVQGL